LNAKGNVTTAVETYTFVDKDYPTILYRLVMGTPRLLFDLVTEDTTLPNTIDQATGKTKRDDRGNWLTGWLEGSKVDHASTDGHIPTVGGLAIVEYEPRNTESTDPGVGFSAFALSNGTFADGTYIPNGRYKVLLRALKITGDVNQDADYEAWLSPVMEFRAAHQ
jgi:hypothetical protein